MKSVLPLFVFIDACGWEIIRHQPFLETVAPHQRRLQSVFGFSSACIPSILSGRLPCEHRNWSYFVYDPVNSPFKSLRWLRWLPAAITSRRIFRRWLSKFVKRQLSFRGYFDLYNIPFQHIALYDFTEKKSPLQAKGLNRGPNIFDFLETRGIPYHVSDPTQSETGNLTAALQAIQSESIDFAFVYWPGLDGLLHMVGNDSPQVPERLKVYEQWVRQLLATASDHYQEVKLYVFSDHGMANCDELLDLKAKIEALPIRMGRDYAAVYDSTMARFWFFNPKARTEIVAALSGVAQGRIVPEPELKELGAWFEDGYFGELIFLVNEGVLIVPSHMGERPIRGMHGYHPAEKHSFAALCTNHGSVPESVRSIHHMYSLMERDAQQAALANRAPAPITVGSESSLSAAEVR